MKVSPFRGLTAVVVVAAPLATAGCGGLTYGTGTPVAQQTVQDITDLVSLGGGPHDDIAYKQRSGKVIVPPTNALPQPRETKVATADGQWPNDPDIAAKRATDAIAAANGPDKTSDGKSPGVYRPPAYKLPDLQTPAGAPPPGVTPPGMDPVAYQAGIAQMAALKAQQAGGVDAEGAPVRKYLTEPPAEYRVPSQKTPPPPAAVADATKDPKQTAQQGGFKWPWQWGQP